MSLCTDELYHARRISRKKRGTNSDEVSRLVEGESWYDNEDNSLLVYFFCASLIGTIVGVLFAVKAHSMGVIVEVVGVGIDTISYGASLLCMWWCQGKPLAYKEKIEFRTAVFSTLLLATAALRIALSCYWQVKCASDVDFTGPGDIACALIQERPHPYMVICITLFMFAAYIPPGVMMVMGRGGLGDISSYSPQEDVNKASAVLHAVCDLAEQAVFISAAGLMVHWPSYALHIDAISGFLVLLLVLAASAKMWYMYFKPAA